MDCFAEFIIGRAFAIRWLAKTRRVLLRAVAEMRPSRTAAPAEIERRPLVMALLAVQAVSPARLAAKVVLRKSIFPAVRGRFEPIFGRF